ncbi:MAG: hypothetical protein GX931_01875 [Acholeplasmataceae bacterium]|nr:hypothetical protein [Acholeplasmataceae bacterium]
MVFKETFKKLFKLVVILFLSLLLFSCNEIKGNYKARVINWDDSLIEELSVDSLDFDEIQNLPNAPEREGYSFDSWISSTDFDRNTITIKAVYKINKYEVVWKNYDGSILKTDQVEYGKMPNYSGVTPTKLATAQYTHIFSNWTPALNVVTENQEYIAEFNSTVNEYEVVFKDWDGTILKSETVSYGEAATEPIKPTREGYDFDKWSVAFDNVTEPIEVVAIYLQHTFTISWKNPDGFIIESTKLRFGDAINLPSKKPFKLPTENHYYEFSKWIGYTEQMIASCDIEFEAEFIEKEFIVEADTKVAARKRYLAAIDYIDRYFEKYPNEKLKIYHGTSSDLTMLTNFVLNLTASATTEEEKVQIIFQWIKDNIEYDESYLSGYAMDVFKSRKGVCLGQSMLMVDMIKIAGIPAVVADGYRGNIGDVITEHNFNHFEGHAWVLAFVNNSWELFDPLWDTYKPNIDYIQSYYYTSTVDWTIPYYPNINLNVTHGMIEIEGYYFTISDGKINRDASIVFTVNNYQINWEIYKLNSGLVYEDKEKAVPPDGATFTDGYLCHNGYQKKILHSYARPNGQLITSKVYQEENEIIYFQRTGTILNIIGIDIEDIELKYGVLSVNVGTNFKFSHFFDKLDEELEIYYAIGYEGDEVSSLLATVDENGYITTLKSGNAVLRYKVKYPGGDSYLATGYIHFIINN